MNDKGLDLLAALSIDECDLATLVLLARHHDQHYGSQVSCGCPLGASPGEVLTLALYEYAVAFGVEPVHQAARAKQVIGSYLDRSQKVEGT